MQEKEVLVLLTDRWADWEAAYAVAGIKSIGQYDVRTIAADKKPKASIGGIRAEIDCAIGDYADFEKLAMLILPGGFSWQEARHDDIAAFVKKAQALGVPIAAICGATIFLGKHGFLDGVKHTGDDLELFQGEEGYNGKDCYESAQVVADGLFITANETAAVDFAYEIFKALKIDGDEGLGMWRDYFKGGAV